MLSSFLAFKRALKRPCILDTNKSNINPETDNEKDDNTSLHEMVIDDNFDKDTNTGIFLHIMQYDFI